MKFQQKESNVIDPDMTPMIDMVFQLIAFFMLVTNFENQQADERVKLPSDQLVRPPQVAKEKVLVINLGFIRDKTGEKIDPDPWIFLGDEQIRVENFSSHLEDEKRLANALHGKGAEKEFTIEIRADGEAPTGAVQELMAAAQNNGYEKFSFRAKQSDGSGN